MTDAWCAAACTELDTLHLLFTGGCMPPFQLMRAARQFVQHVNWLPAVADGAHRRELLPRALLAWLGRVISAIVGAACHHGIMASWLV